MHERETRQRGDGSGRLALVGHELRRDAQDFAGLLDVELQVVVVALVRELREPKPLRREVLVQIKLHRATARTERRAE